MLSAILFYLKAPLSWRQGPKYNFKAQPKLSESKHKTIKALPGSEPKITLGFVGDIMLARNIEKKIDEKDDHTYILNQIEPELKKYDFLFGNLESVISNKGRDIGSKYSFRAPPKNIGVLKQGQFDLVSVANNHSADWTSRAFLDSLGRLKKAGISPCGGGKNKKEAYKPVVKSIDEINIGTFCATNIGPDLFEAQDNSPGFAWSHKKQLLKKIDTAQKEKNLDLIVVSLHFGQEYNQKPSKNQVDLAHSLIDAGADLVVGHHPHVTQPVKTYKDGVIAYSLGNFVFDQLFSEETRNSFILKVQLNHEGQISGIEKKKIRINNNYQPELKNLNPHKK